ncbi:DUF1761 domain-containing protein [Demequina sp. NBRC 110056]|uniref:DUF1761 domain-containing protein n=1 Tax=Demequina sp. NBRC 110056 TaxID=1570345 RepID=UPI000A027F66|nr:DUF1761 domain-containing protein [Demequina sp. NBRC 110056]
MEWLTFEGIPWLGVGLAFLATFVLGWFWYSPQGFFKPWQRAVGFTDEQMKDARMGLAFGQMVLGNVLGLLLLSVLLVALGIDSWGAAALTGALLGFAFRGGAHLLHDGFAIRGPVATWIDIAHDTLALAISGLIIGLFL